MALSTAGQPQPTGYEPPYQVYGQQHLQQQAGGSSMSAVAQLFARLSQEIEEHKPKNCIHFIVDFLCKHYPEHLHGFASIWQMDPDLERERHEVVNFFKAHKISTAVAAHFTNAGYDTLDTLTTLSPDSLLDVEAFNNVKWLPGHKVRLQQIFGEISARIRAYRQQLGSSSGQYGCAAGQYGNSPAQYVNTSAQYGSSAPPFVGRPMIKSGAPVSYGSAAHQNTNQSAALSSVYTPSLVAPGALGNGMPALPGVAPASYPSQYSFT
mmetsp:Transcript_96032/g.310072  ORF Transcript_96032/g.310072 Transcript_96032/m.310072 type:complete len:266 (+) Transcript_96032:82-879(+)